MVFADGKKQQQKQNTHKKQKQRVGKLLKRSSKTLLQAGLPHACLLWSPSKTVPGLGVLSIIVALARLFWQQWSSHPGPGEVAGVGRRGKKLYKPCPKSEGWTYRAHLGIGTGVPKALAGKGVLGPEASTLKGRKFRVSWGQKEGS